MRLAENDTAFSAARVWRDAWPGLLLGLLVTLSVMALAVELEGENTVMSASPQQDPLDCLHADHDRGHGAADRPAF